MTENKEIVPQKVKPQNLFLATVYEGGLASLYATVIVKHPKFGDIKKYYSFYDEKCILPSWFEGFMLDEHDSRWELVEKIQTHCQTEFINFDTLKAINKAFIQFQFQQRKAQETFMDNLLEPHLGSTPEVKASFQNARVNKDLEEMMHY